MPHGQKNKNIKQKQYCNKLNKNIYSRTSVKIRLKKARVCHLNLKYCLPCTSHFREVEMLVLQSATVKNTGLPLLPASRRRAFFQEKQDFSFSYFASSSLLLRLNGRQVWLGSGGSFLYTKAHLCIRGCLGYSLLGMLGIQVSC